jgi:hypothetical protein
MGVGKMGPLQVDFISVSTSYGSFKLTYINSFMTFPQINSTETTLFYTKVIIIVVISKQGGYLTMKEKYYLK